MIHSSIDEASVVGVQQVKRVSIVLVATYSTDVCSTAHNTLWYTAITKHMARSSLPPFPSLPVYVQEPDVLNDFWNLPSCSTNVVFRLWQWDWYCLLYLVLSSISTKEPTAAEVSVFLDSSPRLLCSWWLLGLRMAWFVPVSMAVAPTTESEHVNGRSVARKAPNDTRWSCSSNIRVITPVLLTSGLVHVPCLSCSVWYSRAIEYPVVHACTKLDARTEPP